MNQFLKRILFFPLLVLSLMPVVFSVLFSLQLAITKHKAEEKLEKTMLQTIRLKKEDFTWEKKGKEIRMGKQFFDVKSIREENGEFIITGIYDEQEDLLRLQLISSQKNHDNTSQNKLCNFFFHFFYSVTSANAGYSGIVVAKKVFNEFHTSHYIGPYSFISSPPPDLV